MRVLIATAGSTGDVAPYLGVGTRLAAAGHQVTVAGHAEFAELVGGTGLGFLELPGDPRAVQRSAAGQRLHRGGTGPRGLLTMARLARGYLDELADGMVAVADAHPDMLLLSSTTAPLGYLVARKLGVPSLGLFLQPVEATGDFAPVMTTRRSLGRLGNLALAGGVRGLAKATFAGPVRRLGRRLGLPDVTIGTLDRLQRNENWPVLHGYSPAVLARPRDWRSGLEVVGYWWPPVPDDWRPPAELVEFLDGGEPPVFVGFGSMAGGDALALGELAVVAARRAGLRLVLQSGWAGLSGAGTEPDVYVTGPVPHGWLFPRMAAVVHHAGAGTTAAGLRAGVPAVPVPMIADQGFWADRLVHLGVAPAVLPPRRLRADRLAAALRAAVADPAYRRHATALAARIATEDGPAAVVAAVAQPSRPAGPIASRRPPGAGK